MWTAQFWKDAAERGIKSTAQALILAWPLADGLFDVFDVNPTRAAGIAGGAFLLSLLTSLVSAGVGTSGTASVVGDVGYRRPTAPDPGPAVTFGDPNKTGREDVWG